MQYSLQEIMPQEMWAYCTYHCATLTIADLRMAGFLLVLPKTSSLHRPMEVLWGVLLSTKIADRARLKYWTDAPHQVHPHPWSYLTTVVPKLSGRIWAYVALVEERWHQYSHNCTCAGQKSFFSPTYQRLLCPPRSVANPWPTLHLRKAKNVIATHIWFCDKNNEHFWDAGRFTEGVCVSSGGPKWPSVGWKSPFPQCHRITGPLAQLSPSPCPLREEQQGTLAGM